MRKTVEILENIKIKVGVLRTVIDKFRGFKWEVLITIIISITSVFLAIKANEISNVQTQIARNTALPTIEVKEILKADGWGKNTETSVIEISNLSGKLNNYQSDIVSFLKCDYCGSETGPYETINIPLENYYLLNTKSGTVTGVIEEKSAANNYAKVKDLQNLISQFNKKNTDGQSIETRVQSYLRISYLDLLNEKQEAFYLVSPIKIKF